MSVAVHKQIVLNDIIEFGSADRSDPTTVFELLAITVRARRLGIRDSSLDEINSWIDANPEMVKKTLSLIRIDTIFDDTENILVCENPQPEELLDFLFDVDFTLCALERGGKEDACAEIVAGFAIHLNSLPEEFLFLKDIAKRFIEWNGGPDAGGGNPIWVSLANAKLEDLSEPTPSEAPIDEEIPEWLNEMLEAESKKSFPH